MADNQLEVPDYYNESEMLHWKPNIERKGLGTLIKKCSHIAIVVADVGISMAFYVDVMGFQLVKRPNFHRVGCWLTMGNLELHLIKGTPVVNKEDNLIVPHIALEVVDIQETLKRLQSLGIQFSKSLSVPDATEKSTVTQYFFRDPGGFFLFKDGYYLEICNCEILTDFCLSIDTEKRIEYQELVNQIDITNIFDLAVLAQKVKNHVTSDLNDYVLPKEKWATEANQTYLDNMLKRRKIYGDLMQGETRESISFALLASNNHVPTACRIIRHNQSLKGGQTFIPPSFYIKDTDEEYTPSTFKMENKGVRSQIIPEKNISYKELVKKAFDKFDINGDQFLGHEEIYRVLLMLNQAPSSSTIESLFNGKESISFEDFYLLVTKKRTADSVKLNSFFKILDNDGNKQISCQELSVAIKALGLELSDREIEEIFTEADLDGDGYLTVSELEYILNKTKEEIFD